MERNTRRKETIQATGAITTCLPVVKLLAENPVRHKANEPQSSGL